jgi:non-specific serine/threonine protein kinase/serine/threonine-protein kinase
MFAKICEGVNAAHLRGVIHRDIKPANVRIDPSGEPVVVDFGLARVGAGAAAEFDSSPMTQTGQFVGSLPWASPEQAAGTGDGVDVRSDVYSLGVVLYQLLTDGKFPYPVVGNMRDVLDNIQRVEPARPSTVVKGVDDEIETIALKALAKDRERRYQSAGELGRDVSRYLAGEPIEAKRDSAIYLLQKTIRRHKLPAAFVATVGLLTVVFAAGMTGAWRTADAARAAAVVQKNTAVAERDRAEGNLKSVRELSNTFIFGFNESIENLRGATPARKLVLDKALEYLRLIESQTGDDPDAMLELAEAHERVGDIRGGLFMASTGSTAEASAHYEAAMGLRERVLAVRPEDKAVLAGIARGWDRRAGVLFKQKKYDDAVAAWGRSAEVSRQIGDELNRALSSIRIGESHANLGRSLGSDAEAMERFVIAEGRYREAGALLAGMDSDDGRYHLLRVQNKTVQLQIERAMRLVRSDRAEDWAASRASAEIGVGIGERARATLEAWSAGAPGDARVRRELFLAYHNEGMALAQAAAAAEKAGQADARALDEQALDRYQKAVAIARAGHQADESDLNAMRDLGVGLNKLGNALDDLGRQAEATAAYEEAVRIGASAVKTDPIDVHLHDLAVWRFKTAAMSAEEPGGAGESLARYAEADALLVELEARGVDVTVERRNVARRVAALQGAGGGDAGQP